MGTPDSGAVPDRTVGDALREAELATVTFIASDGYPAIRVRTDEEAAEVAAAALGLSSTEPLTNLRVLREGEEVIEAEWRKAALAIITEYRNFIHRGDPAECAAGDAEDDIRLIRAEWNGTLGIIHAESVVAGCPNPTGEAP